MDNYSLGIGPDMLECLESPNTEIISMVAPTTVTYTPTSNAAAEAKCSSPRTGGEI